MMRKKLPIGIQTFREIREEGCYYVDKTPFALKLIKEGKHYFLSRPRRFGKSLFLDTLAELFSGNRPLFDGLYAEQHWDWSHSYPVIRISFGGGRVESREELDRRIRDLLRINQEALGIDCPDAMDIPGCFGELIRRAEQRYGERAVVLVDEYDKPILDNLTDPPIATQMREGLRNLYSVLKDSDAHLRFVFLTGVSKFRPLLNFEWVNWVSGRVEQAGSRAGEARRSEPLTRRSPPPRSRAWGRQSLAAPAPEPVRRRGLPRPGAGIGVGIPGLPPAPTRPAYDGSTHSFFKRAHFESLYASIPADWYRANPVLHYEGYWASVFYSHIASLGLDLIPEDVTNQGRIDLTLKLDNAILVIEFKRIEGDTPTGEAMAQLKAKADGRPVYLLAVEFSSSRRNVVGWEVQAVAARGPQ